MNKRDFIIFGIIIILIITLLIYYPKIEFYYNGYLYMMSYTSDMIDSEDFKELDENLCYNESYSYNKKRDISIIDFEYKKIIIFKWFKIKYQEGNICKTEYLLEESYIKRFLETAEIISNNDNVDLERMLKNKKPIVDNIKYNWCEEAKYIEYKLDGKYQEMYVSENEEGLIIIQIGHSDEGAKYIAYK